MDQIKMIPKEFLCIIPKFDGEKSILNLFIRKCEYILSNFNDTNNPAQAVYVFHSITSRLHGKAASLLSDREDIETWEQLKELLILYFGDSRSEECVAIELENLRIKHDESYAEFCNRIQHLRSTLLSKVKLLPSQQKKSEKTIIYTNMALNVFLYNLSPDLFRTVRHKNCTTLEDALSVVLEEETFQLQYNSRNISNPRGYRFDATTKLHQFGPFHAFNSQNSQSGLFGSSGSNNNALTSAQDNRPSSFITSQNRPVHSHAFGMSMAPAVSSIPQEKDAPMSTDDSKPAEQNMTIHNSAKSPFLF